MPLTLLTGVGILTNFQSYVIAGGRPAPGAGDANAEMAVIPVPLTLLTGVGAMRLTVPQDLRSAEARQATLLMLRVRPHVPVARQHFEERAQDAVWRS